MADIVRNTDRAATAVEGFAAKATRAAGLIAKGWVVTEVLSRTIRLLGEMTDKAQEITKLAQQMDLTADSFQRLSIAAEKGNTDTQTLVNTFNRLEARLAGGGKQATEAAAALKQLGIDAQAFINLPADERAYAFARAFVEMKDRTTELDAAQTLFGKQAHEMLGLLNQDFLAAADGATTMSGTTVKALKEMGDGFTNFLSETKVKSMEWFVWWVQAWDDWADGFDKAFGQERKLELPEPFKPPKPNIPEPTANLPKAIDPEDMAATEAILNRNIQIQADKVKAAEEAWRSYIGVLKLLKVETPQVTDAITALMAAVDTTTKVENVVKRINDWVERTAQLREETQALINLATGQNAAPADNFGKLTEWLDGQIARIRELERLGDITPAQAMQEETAVFEKWHAALLALQSGHLKNVDAVIGQTNAVRQLQQAYEGMAGAAARATAPQPARLNIPGMRPATDIFNNQIPGLRPFAAGGVVMGPTAALLGEAGPEAVIPLSKLGRGGGDTHVSIVLNDAMVDSPASLDKLARKVVASLSRQQGNNGRHLPRN